MITCLFVNLKVISNLVDALNSLDRGLADTSGRFQFPVRRQRSVLYSKQLRSYSRYTSCFFTTNDTAF
jgi:hypothetical protein